LYSKWGEKIAGILIWGGISTFQSIAKELTRAVEAIREGKDFHEWIGELVSKMGVEIKDGLAHEGRQTEIRARILLNEYVSKPVIGALDKVIAALSWRPWNR
jgi:hypothetical protein